MARAASHSRSRRPSSVCGSAATHLPSQIVSIEAVSLRHSCRLPTQLNSRARAPTSSTQHAHASRAVARASRSAKAVIGGMAARPARPAPQKQLQQDGLQLIVFVMPRRAATHPAPSSVSQQSHSGRISRRGCSPADSPGVSRDASLSEPASGTTEAPRAKERQCAAQFTAFGWIP